MRANGWLVAAAVNGAVAVAVGALAAHGADGISDPGGVELIRIGARYQMWHALALLGVAGLGRTGNARRLGLAVAGWAFLCGIVLFSGGLYLLALTGLGQIAWVVPAGGATFVMGWGALAWAGLGGRA